MIISIKSALPSVAVATCLLISSCSGSDDNGTSQNGNEPLVENQQSDPIGVPSGVEPPAAGEVDQPVVAEVEPPAAGEVDQSVVGQVDQPATGEVDQPVAGEVEPPTTGELPLDPVVEVEPPVSEPAQPPLGAVSYTHLTLPTKRIV